MTEREHINLYKKQIEIFLRISGIYISDQKQEYTPEQSEENRKFIKEIALRMWSGNVNEEILDKAIDELLPYLIERK